MVTLRDEQTELPYAAASVSRETVASITHASARTYRLVSHRWELVRDASFRSPHCYARIPSDAAAILLERIGAEARECFAVLPLNARNLILAVDVIASGTVNSCPVSAADVFRRVLAHADAAGVIVGHNHPSGNVKPSSDDRLLTKRLKNAGKVLGVGLLDHVVVSAVGEGVKFWSFQEHGDL